MSKFLIEAILKNNDTRTIQYGQPMFSPGLGEIDGKMIFTRNLGSIYFLPVSKVPLPDDCLIAARVMVESPHYSECSIFSQRRAFLGLAHGEDVVQISGVKYSPCAFHAIVSL